MTCKVLDTVRKYGMLDGVSSICVGVSGGADSVALLHLLLKLREAFGYELMVVHVNHHLRGKEADRDAAFVQALCEKWNVPCIVVDRDVVALAKTNKESLEVCGRNLRYAAFEEQGCDVIAVAHTRSDSIETSMFHLARGTSLKGAGGIPPKQGKIIRPLIECTRAQVEAYLQENDLDYVTDSSNLTDEFTRNFMRHSIVKPLCDRFPAFETTYARFMENAVLAQSFLDQTASAFLEAATEEDGYALEPLQTAHPAVLQCCIRQILSDAMQKPVEGEHIALCCRAVADGHGKIEIAADRFFCVERGRITVQKAASLTAWSVPVPATPCSIKSPYGSYRIEVLEGESRNRIDRRHWIDPQKVNGALALRSRLAGDVFHSPVRKQSKTLKKLFNEMKLSLTARAACAVLAVDDPDHRVVWLEGVGVDAAFQADCNTDPVWIITGDKNHAFND